jgi:hypothetical protein
MPQEVPAFVAEYSSLRFIRVGYGKKDYPSIMNTAAILAAQDRHFADSYRHFEAFGGPCVYFHTECLRAGRDAFLSERHLEMLYATLTAWGMHRMGDAENTKTRLTEWKRFRDSFLAHADELRSFLPSKMVQMSEAEYSASVLRLRACYRSLELSVSKSTVVVNSKALHHLFPEFIPPIDRQYTVRFFTQPPEKWKRQDGKFRQVQLPAGFEAQFKLFHEICVRIKRLADKIDPRLLEAQRLLHGVDAPKAVDNAIVDFVRTVSVQTIIAAREIGL